MEQLTDPAPANWPSGQSVHVSAAPSEYVFLGQLSTPVRFEFGILPAPAVEQNDDPAELEYSPFPSQVLQESVAPWLFSPGSHSTWPIRNAGEEVESITRFPV